VTSKHICQLAMGMTIAACMIGCEEDKPATIPGQDASIPKDARDVARQPEVSPDAPPSDPRLQSETLVDQAGGPAVDSGIDSPPTSGQDVGAVMDVEAPKDSGLDGFATLLEAGADSVDAPATDSRADGARSDVAREGGSGSEAGIDMGPVCAEGTTQSCASPGNPLIGACHTGTRVCSGGVWGPCSEVLPAASEACNGIDDNCNGLIDEGCAAGCIVVCGNCSTADGAAADGSVERPFASIEAAMAAATPIDGGTQRRICVVGGSTCRQSALYQTQGPLKMTDGLIIQGAYAITESGLEYCGVAALKPRTTLSFTSNEGVVFDQAVAAGAELSGVVIEVNPPIAPDPAAATVVPIAVKGGKNVTISRVFVTEGFAGATTYGVAITAGGQATITGSSISSGQGRTSAVGVYVNGGTANLRNNCDRIVDGKCASYCADGGSMLGMHGYLAESAADAPAQSAAVLVAGSPATLIGNMICGGTNNIAEGQAAATVGALRCEGLGCGTVSGNVIAGGFGREAVAVALVGADPQMDGNLIEGGCGDETTTALWLESSSARLQNNRILGGQCPGTGTPAFYGLHLLSSGTSDNPEVHSNDIEPLGLSADCQSIGVLVERASGADSATGGVLRNNIISAGVCSVRFGIREASGAALKSLQNNDLYAPTSELATTSLVLYRHGSTDATTAAQVNATGLASGTISDDPGYASYPRDLHLTAQSPCIDQGTSANAPAADADGNARPAGAGYDIGAYELTM
jgi:hypothetical protein